MKPLAVQSYCLTLCYSNIIKITCYVQFDAALLFSLHHIQFIGWKWRSLYIYFDNYPWAVSKIHSGSISSQQLPCHPLSLSLPFILSLVHYCITLKSCWAKGYKQIPLNQRKEIAIAMGTRTPSTGFSGWRKGHWWITACKSFPWWWEDRQREEDNVI